MESNQSPAQAAVKPGLLIGIILTVISFLVYFVDYRLLASGWVSFLSLLVYGGLVIYFGIQYRKELGGYMDFGPAFQFSFFTLLIILAISTLGNMLLFGVIDPGLPEKMADVGLENAMEIMDNFGVGDAMSSEQMDMMRQGVLDGYTVSGMLKGAGVAVLFYAVLALILGAIIKKKDKSLNV